jgi:hypothetical protein
MQGAAHTQYIPSPPYLVDVFLQTSQPLRAFALQHQQQLSGCIIKMDHTFKVCKFIKNVRAGEVFAACFSVQNEHGQILLQRFTQTKADEVAVDLAALRDRLQGIMIEVGGSDVAHCRQLLDCVAIRLLTTMAAPIMMARHGHGY